jgi:hypothetical protein
MVSCLARNWLLVWNTLWDGGSKYDIIEFKECSCNQVLPQVILKISSRR